MAIQVNKLKKLNHVLDEEYQITHILGSLPREYSSVVEQVKIDRRTGSTLINRCLTDGTLLDVLW